MEEVGKSKVVELASMNDLIRLIISNSAQRGGFLYCGKKDGKILFYISHVIPSWYEFKGLPVVIYSESDVYPEENFIAYYRPTTTDEEHWKFTAYVKDNDPKVMYIPIVKVKEIPDFTF